MLDHTTNPIVRKTRDLLLRALSPISTKIFQADDHHAREHGWQISSRHRGLSPTYSDPHFDSLISRTACNGHGFKPGRITCPGWSESDRLVLDPARPERRW
jgi:hypothetical protein